MPNDIVTVEPDDSPRPGLDQHILHLAVAVGAVLPGPRPGSAWR